MQSKHEEIFYYLGQPFSLHVIEQHEHPEKMGKQSKSSCLLEFIQEQQNEDTSIDPKASTIDSKASLNIYWFQRLGKPLPLLLRNVMVEWFKQRARHVILERVRYWSHIMNLSYNRVTLKDQKTRWGSCSSLRNLNFNWRLIMAPIDVLDYVVIHELTHLREMNHSKIFWKIVGEYCPEYRQHKDWLKKYGADLFTV